MDVSSGPAEAGCLMSYAYWDARILKRQQLVNPQTGALDAITVEDQGRQLVSVGGAPREAHRYALTSARFAVLLWYSPEGEWLQLDSVTRDGKRLRYRLN
jgi:hypothetical protein